MKQLLYILTFLFLSLTAMAATPEKLFLKPNSNWTKDNARFAFKATVLDYYDVVTQENVYYTEYGVTEAADRETVVDKIFDYYDQDLWEITFRELCPGVAFFLKEEEYDRICKED
jgi:hypothetical protein